MPALQQSEAFDHLHRLIAADFSDIHCRVGTAYRKYSDRL